MIKSSANTSKYKKKHFNFIDTTPCVYSKISYSKIINMDLTVPAKCNTEGVEFKMYEGFGTPLTIFTKNGKVIDCISGYVNRNSLIEKLKNNNLISE